MEEPSNISSTNDSSFLNTSEVPQDVNGTSSPASGSSVAKFYPILVTEMILSIICLILTIIVYSILPEFKNVHGKNLISLSSCLLTTFIFLCLDIILRHHINYSFCFIIAIIIHVSFLGTFFWTNVMSFDIWCNMTSMKAKCQGKSNSRKYLKYSIYAWIATALTTLPAVVLESTNMVPLMYRPQFGLKRCWLSGQTAFIYYFNLPVGIILLGNLVMFVLTIKNLLLIKKTTAVLNVKHQQQRLNLYLKLFFVMGIIWISEFLPWATKNNKLYALAGVLTTLQGFLLFVIFVLKKRILRQIWKKMTGKEIFKKSSSSQQTFSSSGSQLTSHADSGKK